MTTETEKSVTSSLNIPKPFDGTDEERLANQASHEFYSWDPDEGGRCTWCDSRPSHTAADYPCGANVPRLRRVFYSDGTHVDIDMEIQHEEAL